MRTCVPTWTYLTFNNDKPWFSTKHKQLRQAKEDAYRSGNKALYKQAKYRLNREMRVAKKNYSGKLKKTVFKQQLYISVDGPESHHQLQDPTPSTEASQQLAEDLNEFYCRFEKQKPGLTPHTNSDRLTTQPSTPSPSLPHTVSQPVLKICEDVRRVFRRQKIRKAKGPDGVSPDCLKACAGQLSSIFTLIFNRSLELCEVPSCFKCDGFARRKIKTLNHYQQLPLSLLSTLHQSMQITDWPLQPSEVLQVDPNERTVFRDVIFFFFRINTDFHIFRPLRDDPYDFRRSEVFIYFLRGGGGL